MADVVVDASGDGDIYAAAEAAFEKVKDNIRDKSGRSGYGNCQRAIPSEYLQGRQNSQKAWCKTCDCRLLTAVFADGFYEGGYCIFHRDDISMLTEGCDGIGGDWSNNSNGRFSENPFRLFAS